MILSTKFNRGHTGQQSVQYRKPPPQSPAPHPTTSSTLGRLSRIGRQDKNNQHAGSLPPHSNGIYAPSSYIYNNNSTRLDNGSLYQTTSSQYRAPSSLLNGQARDVTITSSKKSQNSGRESALGGFFRGLNGTLRRKSKNKSKPSSKDECEDIYAEGLKAIDGNAQRPVVDYDNDDKALMNLETRTFIDQESLDSQEYRNLERILINWINDELADQRIIVKEMQDDLHDGQILGKLVEKMHGMKLDVIEVTQNETIQRHKLRTVLETINRILTTQARWAKILWSVDGIHKKDLVEIIQLLITLAYFYRAPITIPNNVIIKVNVKQRQGDKLITVSHQVNLTNITNDVNNNDLANKMKDRDAFDTLFDHAPEKLTIVKRSLANFVNRHLRKINIDAFSNYNGADLDPMQFSDGLLFIFLISSLEDYFVPFGLIFTQTTDKLNSTANTSMNMLSFKTALQPNNYINTQPIHKLHNVNVAFQLLEDAGVIVRDRVRAEDIVNGDLKSTLRILYLLFSRYKHL